jgi:hypothetical protein
MSGEIFTRKPKKYTKILGAVGVCLSLIIVAGIFTMQEQYLNTNNHNTGNPPSNPTQQPPEDPTPPVQPEASPYVYIGNFMFYLAGYPGDGSPGAPFVIEDQDFTGAWCTSSLEIVGVTYHIRIQNCTFRNAGKSSILQEFGLLISESPNVTVTNCTFIDSENGILVHKASGVSISNCSVANIQETGIKIDQSTDCHIFDNLLTECTHAVAIVNANRTSIHGNRIHANIVALRSEESPASSAYCNDFSENLAVYMGDDSLNFTTDGQGNSYSHYGTLVPEFDMDLLWTAPDARMHWLPEGGIFKASEPFNISASIIDSCPLIYMANDSAVIIHNMNDGQTFGLASPTIVIDITPAIPSVVSINIDGITVNMTSLGRSNSNSLHWAGKINSTHWASLAPGSHEVAVVAESVLGKTTTFTINVIIDNEAPTVQISVNPVAGLTAPSFIVEVQDFSPINFVQYQLLGPALFTANISLTETSPSLYTSTIEEYAWDCINNASEVVLWVHAGDSCNNNISVNATIQKLLTAPQITLKPINTIYFGAAPPAVEISAIDPDLADCWWTINGISLGSIDSSQLPAIITIGSEQWDLVSEGPILIKVFADDTYGTIGSSECFIVKDLTPPKITVLKPLSSEIGLANLYTGQEYMIGIQDEAPIVSVEVNLGSEVIYSGAPSSQVNHVGIFTKEIWSNAVDNAYNEGKRYIILFFTVSDEAGNSQTLNYTINLPEIQDYPEWSRALLKIPLNWVIIGGFTLITGIAVGGWVKYSLLARKAKKQFLKEEV